MKTYAEALRDWDDRSRKIVEDAYQRGYSDAYLLSMDTVAAVKEELTAEAEKAMEDLEDRCCCDDCAGMPERERHTVTAAAYSADAMRDAIEESIRREFESGIAGFVVCVNDEPYPDTFSEDAAMTWQLFLPILEADPGLGNEDVRLVKLIEE